MTQVQSLDSDLQGLPLASLVTSAFITYLPMMPEEQRASIQKDWTKMLGLSDYDLCRFMSTESEMLKWKMEGLPADGLSMQNAVIILNSARTPLIIDPSSQVSYPIISSLTSIFQTSSSASFPRLVVHSSSSSQPSPLPNFLHSPSFLRLASGSRRISPQREEALKPRPSTTQGLATPSSSP